MSVCDLFFSDPPGATGAKGATGAEATKAVFAVVPLCPPVWQARLAEKREESSFEATVQSIVMCTGRN